jgi:hypothetical protein
MKLGLMTAALPALSLEQVAAWASENGFEMLEIACWPPGKAERRYAGVTHIDVTEFDALMLRKPRKSKPSWINMGWKYPHWVITPIPYTPIRITGRWW